MAKTYLIVGAGRSGIDSAKLLLQLGEDFVLFDGKTDLDTAAVCERIGKPDCRFILGALKEGDLDGIDVCVTSPGVPLFSDVLQAVAAKGIPIWSEIELAYRHDKGTVIAITGTNGKTTTTALTYAIFKAWNEHTLLVGNIEIPYTGLVLESVDGGYTVAEISSFQLETMRTVKPKVSAILNITPDHLDRHGSMDGYIAVKESITQNQDKSDFCVLNYEDDVLRGFGAKAPCNVVFFSSRRVLDEGWYYRDGAIYLCENGETTQLLRTDEVHLVGLHNFENIMAAAAMAHCAGVPLDIIRNATKQFVAVEHRIEFVREKDGVKYYNDSKGTNTDAAIKAIEAMPGPTVLIGGGYDKHADFTDWVARFPSRVKKLILLGQTAQQIAATCDKLGFSAYCFVDSLEEAVRIAHDAARSGDCVLLSPACASWGMFKNYQQRGTMFKDFVRAL
ncbi:MAG: UDP-N-acetylmuramoyl-L-alanine--D-glutamate ligase [Clostridia bacterium]|nr:UDP-N-acetylmuramoyl-L-alanine--D-glutamate ligase [Clostridia bacterium]